MECFFDEEINRFIDHINSLESTLPLIMLILYATTKSSEEKLNDFIKENKIEKINEDRGKSEYKLTFDQLTQFRRLNDQFTNSVISHNILPRSFIVSLVSQYDAYIGRLIKTMFYVKPGYLNASEKNLTYSQIVEFASFDDVKEYVIEKEVESVLRKSHEDQFKWFENKLDMTLRKGLDVWSTFIELTERRNLFVHCNGEISSQYISVCKENDVTFDLDCKVGEILNVPRNYFERAYKCIFEIGVKLAHVLWRKLCPEEREQADLNVNNICFNLIDSEKYDLAITLLEFATDFKKFSSEEVKLMLNINKAQAYKWLGDNDKCNEILGNFDWSAYSLKFRLAKAVLSEDFKYASQLMKRIGINGEIKKANYRDWPIFKEFRNSNYFLDIYQELFHEKFEIVDEEEKGEIVTEIEKKGQIALSDISFEEAAPTKTDD